MNERIAKLYDQAIVVEDGGDFVTGELDPEKFAELVRADEREACAKVCENMERNGAWITKAEAAEAIRSRGEK